MSRSDNKLKAGVAEIFVKTSKRSSDLHASCNVVTGINVFAKKGCQMSAFYGANRSVFESQSANRFGLLEAQAIQIFREVAAEAENPVFLYSVGKDSAVMLHLALKAFYPATPPFRFLHIDTTWKFREMIEFRDNTMSQLGIDLPD